MHRNSGPFFAIRECSVYSCGAVTCFPDLKPLPAMWRRLLSLWSSPRVVLRRVLALDDSPHAVALGAAIGMLFGMTPTVGLQTIEVILFALVTRRMFYFNRAAALTVIYVSNPLTIAPIYYALYQVGSCFVPGEATLEQFEQILAFEGFAGWWLALTELAVDIGIPLGVGTAVVAPLVAVVTYPVTRFLLQWYRGNGPPAKNSIPAAEHEDAESKAEREPKKIDAPQTSTIGPRPSIVTNRSALSMNSTD
ncbi:MAG: DUF2062 domain-containing protein [Planctomycetaceae bacterium]